MTTSANTRTLRASVHDRPNSPQFFEAFAELEPAWWLAPAGGRGGAGVTVFSATEGGPSVRS